MRKPKQDPGILPASLAKGLGGEGGQQPRGFCMRAETAKPWRRVKGACGWKQGWEEAWWLDLNRRLLRWRKGKVSALAEP